MVKTCRVHTFKPRVCRSFPPSASSSNPGPAIAVAPLASSLAAAIVVPVTTATTDAAVSAPTAAQGSTSVGSFSTAPASYPPSASAPAPRRYHTQVGIIPPSPPYPRPSQRAPLSKRSRTSSPGECSSSRPQEPQSPPHQGPTGAPPLNLSPASIIRRPLFHYSPIPGNADCSGRDLHDEDHYDLSAFTEDPELRDSMLLVQRYSLEPFMTPRQFYYPQVVIEFYHTMTSRREPNPTAIHFSIDVRLGILRASDIASAFHMSVVLF